MHSHFEEAANSDGSAAAGSRRARTDNGFEARYPHAAARAFSAQAESGEERGASINADRTDPPWARSTGADSPAAAEGQGFDRPGERVPAVVASDAGGRSPDGHGGGHADPQRAHVSTGQSRAHTSSESSGGTAVRGRVRRSDGSGISDAALTLIDRSGRQVGRGVSGGDGGFGVEAPGTGSYVLIASAEAHQPEASTIVVGNQPVDVDIVLAGTAGLYGTVAAAGSGPIAGATVTMADSRGEVVGTQQTSSSGEYNFPDLIAGAYTLVASAESYRPFATGVTVPGVGAARQDVELVGGSRLHGTARAGKGLPVADARITLLDSAGNVVAVTNTDETGEYCFDDLAEGDYTVIASGYPPVASTLQVGGDERGEHDVELGHPDA